MPWGSQVGTNPASAERARGHEVCLRLVTRQADKQILELTLLLACPEPSHPLLFFCSAFLLALSLVTYTSLAYTPASSLCLSLPFCMK